MKERDRPPELSEREQELRDAEKLFPVSVGWDAAAKVATLALNYKQ